MDVIVSLWESTEENPDGYDRGSFIVKVPSGKHPALWAISSSLKLIVSDCWYGDDDIDYNKVFYDDLEDALNNEKLGYVALSSDKWGEYNPYIYYWYRNETLMHASGYWQVCIADEPNLTREEVDVAAHPVIIRVHEIAPKPEVIKKLGEKTKAELILQIVELEARADSRHLGREF